MPASDILSKYIFLSYGHDEFAAFAQRLKRDLEADGYHVWFDVDRLTEGQDWENYIEEGLEEVAANRGQFLLLMTPHSVRRPNGFCLNELARALGRNLRVVPVMLASCEPPLSICRLQYLDLRDCVPVEERLGAYRKKLDRLKDALEHSNLDFQGVQTRLLTNLRPLDFDADLRARLRRFVGREWIIERIDRWLAEDDAPRVLWLTGPPGVGKSALAAWYSYRRPEVAALHFCRSGHTEKSDPRRAVLSIAYQLSSQYPDYQASLNALDLAALTKTADAATLFDDLITQQLPTAAPCPGRKALIIIDGLDEATSEHSNPLAELIAAEFDKTPNWLRLLVTSRPEAEVRYALQAFTPLELQGTSPENMADARRFVVEEYGRLAPDGHVTEGAVEEVLKRSEGIFLYLEWVRQELQSGRLSLDRLDDFPQGLGGVYAQFFADRFPDKKAFKSDFRPALQAVVAAREPLDPTFLAQLFNWSDYERREKLAALGSMFVDVTGRVQPFHRTLVEWLADERKAGPYFVSRSEGERMLSDAGWRGYELDAGGLPRYFLKHLPAHLAAVGSRQADLRRLLLDFTWMRAKLEAASISSLLGDFDLLTPDGGASEQPPRLVQESLRLSAHVLATRKSELPSQLTGRLLAFEQADIRRLLQQAAEWRNGPWLKPLTPDLNPPGSSLVGTFTDPAVMINAVGITPDGDTVILATDEFNDSGAPPALKVWRVHTAEPPATLCQSRVTALAVSPDGSALASAADDRTVSIWSLAAAGNQPLHVPAELSDSVTALAFVKDATRLMLVYESGRVQLWRLTSEPPELLRDSDLGEDFRRQELPSSKPVAVAPEANAAFTGTGFISADTWHMWDIGEKRLILSSRAHGFKKIAVTPDATRLIWGETTVEVWDRRDEVSQPVLTLPGHGYLITALAITPNGRRAVSASFNELRVWDLDPRRVSAVPFGRGVFIGEIVVTADGKQAVALHEDDNMRLWELTRRQLVRSVKLSMRGAGILAATDDGRLIIGSAEGLHSYDLASGEMIPKSSTPRAGRCVAVTPDHAKALSAAPDGRLVVWEVETGHVLHTLDADFNPISGSVALFPDGKRAVVSSGNSLVVWDILSGVPVNTLNGHTWFIDALAVGLTPAGIRIISGSRDKTVRIWNPDRADPLLTLVGHTYTVGGVAVLPGGLQLISCGDNSLRVWDIQTGRCEATFTADTSLIKCACAPDGKIIVVGDLAGQVHFLEYVGTGRLSC